MAQSKAWLTKRAHQRAVLAIIQAVEKFCEVRYLPNDLQDLWCLDDLLLDLGTRHSNDRGDHCVHDKGVVAHLGAAGIKGWRTSSPQRKKRTAGRNAKAAY